MTRAEILACLGGRPCDACKLNEEGGCVRWSCVFEEEPDDSENDGEWIPVSDRLPEMGVRVLCACQADIYDVLKLTPEGWLYDTRHTYMLGFVKAWQPLPEPYKAEKGGE